MSKIIALDSSFGWMRMALAEAGTLADFYEERLDQGNLKGNIYRGIVRKVDSQIQAAFVRYGAGRDGFLPLKDVGTTEQASLESGSVVLVQVVKDEVGEKGATLSTRLSYSGRSLVFLPQQGGEGGISSRLPEEERSSLRARLRELRLPAGGSIILRTAALGRKTPELQAEVDRLVGVHSDVVEQGEQRKDTGLLFRDAPPAVRYLREYLTSDVETVWVNREDLRRECLSFLEQEDPGLQNRVKFSDAGSALFSQLGFAGEIARLADRKVVLASGANIVIDVAEALVAIDVNSARVKGEGEPRAAEATAFAVNCEAAREICRQIRLRDLGGIIVADFIDMEEEAHKLEVLRILRDGVARDKAKVKVYGMSPLGLAEISRQRLRRAGGAQSWKECESCSGRGRLPDSEVAVAEALRKMEETLRRRKGKHGITVTCAFPVANALWNQHGKDLRDLEAAHQCSIAIAAEGRTDAPTAIQITAEPNSHAGHAPSKERLRPAREKKTADPSPRKQHAPGGNPPVALPAETAPLKAEKADPVLKSGRRRRRGGRGRGGQGLKDAAKPEKRNPKV